MEREGELPSQDTTEECPTTNIHHAEMFTEGARLEAKDHMGERWWEAKVLEVDSEGSEVLVHFAGWNGRHDEWIKMDSPRLQPYTRRSSRRRQSTGDGSGPESSQSPRSGGTLSSTPTYHGGEEVMALWQNGRKYPAKVQKMELDGSVSVQFYDGFIKSVRPINVRRLLDSDREFVRDCKEQQASGSNPSTSVKSSKEPSPGPVDLNTPEISTSTSTSSTSSSTTSSTSTTGGQLSSKVKRERKTKFNVREVLNLKETSPKSSKTSSSSPKVSLSVRGVAAKKDSSLDVSVGSEAFERSDKIFEAEESKLVVGRGDNEERVEEDEDLEEEVAIGGGGGGHIEVVDLSESFDVKSETCGISETGSEGTPSEKENINNDNGPTPSRAQARIQHRDTNGRDTTSNGVSQIRGKRARKRKRFADEDPGDGQSAKYRKSCSQSRPPSTQSQSIPRLLPSTQRQTVKQTSRNTTPNKSTGEIHSKVLTSKRNSDSARKRPRDKTRVVEERREGDTNRTLIKSPQNNNSTNGSDSMSSYSYLNFDFTLPPDQLLPLLEEGVTVPGSLNPVLMAAPKLPHGWCKKVSLRPLSSGISTRWDVTIESPEGRAFKSRQELSRHFEEAELEHNLEMFDFNLDTPLKKLRQLWKANLPVPDTSGSPERAGDKTGVGGGLPPTSTTHHHTPTARPSPASPHSSCSPSLTPSSPPPTSARLPQPSSSPSSPTTPSTPPLSESKQFPRKALRLPPTESEKQKLEITMRVGPLSPGTPVIGNLSETGQGVRCPLKNCNKLFRNEKLLLQHVKHYHPEYTDVVGYSPSVTDLAFQRTRLREDSQSLESGGILLETLRNAERRAELKTEKTTTVEVKAPPDIPAVSDIRRHQQQPTDVVSNVTTATTTSTTNSSDVTPALVVRTAEQTPPPKRLSVDVRKLEVKEGGEVVVPVMTSSVTSVVTSSVPVVTTSPVTVTMPQVSLATSSVSEPSIPPLVATPGSPMVEDRVVPDTPKSESVRPRPKRLRTDSVLSVGTESGLTTPPPSPPPTPAPSYKLSRRRAQQLRSTPGTPGVSPPGEREEVQTMEEDEVVNCRCRHPDGDGMMVQCEVCLTWQHGVCIGVDCEEQVPQHYICSICRDPPLGRESALYCIDHEWIREGKLPGLSSSSSSEKDATLKQLSSLMADLCSLSAVLHSLQVKLAVAAQRNNPKVFMWSSQWQTSSSLAATSEATQPTQDLMTAPDLFPANMESLLGGMEEAGETVGGETGVTNSDTSNIKESSKDSDTAAAAATSSSPVTDPILPGGHKHKSSSSSSVSQVIDSQESQSHIPNPEPGGIVTSHAFKTEGSHQPQGDSDQQSIEAGSRLSSGHHIEAGPSQHVGERMEPSLVGRTQDTASIEGEESEMVPHNVEDGIVDGSLTGPGGQYHHIESRPGQSSTAPPGLASGSLESPVKKPEFSSELANLFSGANGDFPAGLQLPSVSELQLLLPGVIKDISQGGDTSYPQQAVRGTNPTLIPEPKRLDREECRTNLLHHVEELQQLVDARLQQIEERLEALESSTDTASSTSKSSSSISPLLQDIRSAKKLNSSLPDRI